MRRLAGVAVEDHSLGGARIDPLTDQRPDRRPSVRENAGELGDLADDFDFTQPPQPPLILPLHPAPGPASIPGPTAARDHAGSCP